MANILEVREVPIDALVVGRGQVRVRKVDADIDELATSIRIHGLLEPILICPHGIEDEKFEILAGQRRVLAYQRLGHETIMAAITDKPTGEETAKAISLTENIIRRDLDAKDVIDACTVLYKRYGSARAVADETGIPYTQVLKHLKYDRLHPELQAKVDVGEVDLNTALKAQDAVAAENGHADSVEAVDLAEALATMSGAEQRQLIREKKANPKKPTKQILENFWNENEKNRQMVVTLPEGIHRSIQTRAKQTGVTQDQLAAGLICAAVKSWADDDTGLVLFHSCSQGIARAEGRCNAVVPVRRLPITAYDDDAIIAICAKRDGGLSAWASERRYGHRYGVLPTRARRTSAHSRRTVGSGFARSVTTVFR